MQIPLHVAANEAQRLTGGVCFSPNVSAGFSSDQISFATELQFRFGFAAWNMKLPCSL